MYREILSDIDNEDNDNYPDDTDSTYWTKEPKDWNKDEELVRVVTACVDEFGDIVNADCNWRDIFYQVKVLYTPVYDFRNNLIGWDVE